MALNRGGERASVCTGTRAASWRLERRLGLSDPQERACDRRPPREGSDPDKTVACLLVLLAFWQNSRACGVS